MSTFIHHPIRVVEDEFQHLREVESEGESAETPLIALAAVATVVLPLALLMVALAFGIARLVTGAFV
jgi:hypothetical protein